MLKTPMLNTHLAIPDIQRRRYDQVTEIHSGWPPVIYACSVLLPRPVTFKFAHICL